MPLVHLSDLCFLAHRVRVTIHDPGFCCLFVPKTASAISVRQIQIGTALATVNAFWQGGAYAEGCDSGRSEAYFRTLKHKMVQCKFFKQTSMYF